MDVAYVFLGFVAMLLLMALSMPVAIAMAAVGIVGGMLAYGMPFTDSIAPVVWGVQNDSLLTAIPLFIFLGELLLRSGIADKMYLSLSAWLGHLPGGLLHTNIGSCALFAATSGSSVATAATVGTVALPALQERGYSMRKSLGSIAAGGTLGILIPPSVNLIVYGSLTNNSIGQLFIAGIFPGLLLTACFMLYIWLSNLSDNEMRTEERIALAQRVKLLWHLVPPFLIFATVMGSLYLGIATAIESASLGVVLALLFVWKSGNLNRAVLTACFISTGRTAGMILFVIVAAFILNLAVSLTGVAELMSNWVGGFNFSPSMMMLVFAVFYLVLGMFMDVLSMQVATIPITYPIALSFGIDPIWFGIFIILMCELALVTPPVGMNLFVVHGIRPDSGGVMDVIMGTLPYVVILFIFTALLIYVPEIAIWLPRQMQ